MKIAIDGPAGSGKSTIAKYLSHKLDFLHIDTGAMYRGITYLILKNKLRLNDKATITKLVNNSLFLFNENGLFINNINIEKEIRKNKISEHVSVVSALPYVREILVKKQKDIASKITNVILDGRDIGTVVLPYADLKIYLKTTIEERVNRRLKELSDKGELIDFKTLIEQISQRDKKDINRSVGPLKKADDAILIITDGLSIEAVGEKIIKIINKKQYKSISFANIIKR